jgi:hypothetical protein
VIRSQHSRLFEELLAERRQALLESLVLSLDPMSVGMIRGLDEARKLSEEADFKLSGEK